MVSYKRMRQLICKEHSAPVIIQFLSRPDGIQSEWAQLRCEKVHHPAIVYVDGRDAFVKSGEYEWARPKSEWPLKEMQANPQLTMEERSLVFAAVRLLSEALGKFPHLEVVVLDRDAISLAAEIFEQSS